MVLVATMHVYMHGSVHATAGQPGSDRGSPNDGSTSLSNRVSAQIRSPVRVRGRRSRRKRGGSCVCSRRGPRVCDGTSPRRYRRARQRDPRCRRVRASGSGRRPRRAGGDQPPRRRRRHGGDDRYFVNAIGIPQQGMQGIPLTDLAVESFSLPITTYARAHFVTGRAAARHMIGQKSGVVLMHTPEPARLAIPLLGGMSPAWAAHGSAQPRLFGGVGVLWGACGVPANHRHRGNPDDRRRLRIARQRVTRHQQGIRGDHGRQYPSQTRNHPGRTRAGGGLPGLRTCRRDDRYGCQPYRRNHRRLGSNCFVNGRLSRIWCRCAGPAAQGRRQCHRRRTRDCPRVVPVGVPKT